MKESDEVSAQRDRSPRSTEAGSLRRGAGLVWNVLSWCGRLRTCSAAKKLEDHTGADHGSSARYEVHRRERQGCGRALGARDVGRGAARNEEQPRLTSTSELSSGSQREGPITSARAGRARRRRARVRYDDEELDADDGRGLPRRPRACLEPAVSSSRSRFGNKPTSPRARLTFDVDAATSVETGPFPVVVDR